MTYEVQLSAVFAKWLDRLRDRQAASIIVNRLLRVERGNLGDVKPVGFGVSELRFAHGPGYRLYFTRKGDAVIVLLCGGDKSSQAADIARAQEMAKEVHDANRA